MIMFDNHFSCVEVPIHESKSTEVQNESPNLVKPGVWLVELPHHLTVGPIAERSVRWVLAVADLEVATLVHVECDRTVPSHRSVAQAVTPRSVLWNSTRTPTINFPFLQIHIVRVKSGYVRQTCRSVFSFRVRNWFGNRNRFLNWEISHIRFASFCPRSWRLQNLGRRRVSVS